MDSNYFKTPLISHLGGQHKKTSGVSVNLHFTENRELGFIGDHTDFPFVMFCPKVLLLTCLSGKTINQLFSNKTCLDDLTSTQRLPCRCKKHPSGFHIQMLIHFFMLRGFCRCQGFVRYD